MVLTVEGKIRVHGADNGRDALGHDGGIAEGAHGQNRLAAQGDCQFRKERRFPGMPSRRTPPLCDAWYTPTICHSMGGPRFGDAGNQLLDDNEAG